MSCNSVIHDELENMEENICPFCGKQLVDVKNFTKPIESCCSKQEIINDNGMNVCKNCGLVQYYNYHIDYIDFNENKYKLRKKSVYIRKYHIENVLNSITSENHIQLTFNQKERIYKIFVEIGGVLEKVNNDRKRMISVKFIIKKLFMMLKLPYKDIQVTKTKKTLEYYEEFWADVELLIGYKIQSILTAVVNTPKKT